MTPHQTRALLEAIVTGESVAQVVKSELSDAGAAERRRCCGDGTRQRGQRKAAWRRLGPSRRSSRPLGAAGVREPRGTSRIADQVAGVRAIPASWRR